MNHHQPVFSLPGTPLADRSVGELVAERPNLSRVFHQHALDFCCQGGRTVRDACAARGVELTTVVADLERAMDGLVETGSNPTELPLPELIDHIVARYHEHLRRELPRLHAMSKRVAQVHGGHTPSLVEVLDTFRGLAEELFSHMEKEEVVLFPAIRELVDSGPAAMGLEDPVRCMMAEHDDAGAALARLKELTNGYAPPPEACNTYRSLFAGLAELESDMHRHIHLENTVLFPAALALQAD